MASIRFPLTVELEDGKTWDVVADQRDAAAWEVQSFGCSTALAGTKGMAFGRFLAWSASKRQDLTKLDWAKFDRQCIEVTDQKVEEPPDAADPGQPAASAE